MFTRLSQDLLGKTGRTLDHRLKEHKHALTSMNSLNSALAEHAINHNHVINWSGAKVLEGYDQLWQRCSLEAWHIRAQP